MHGPNESGKYLGKPKIIFNKIVVFQTQVQQLQGSMHDILQCMTVFCALPQKSTAAAAATTSSTTTAEVRDNCGTQTEIIAVHTPQVDNPPFPFKNRIQRPSTLPLDPNDTSPMMAHEVMADDAHCETGGGDGGDKPTFSKIDEESSPNFNIENTKELIIKN